MSERLHIGWNPNLDVPSAVRLIPPDRRDALCVLVSVVDSTPGVGRLPSLIPLLDEIGVQHIEIGDDVLVGTSGYFALADERGFFTGFDEVWLFDERPSEGKPEMLRLTSDRPLSSAPNGLATWMNTVRCVGGLGDGHGLNFATFDTDLARRWEPASGS